MKLEGIHHITCITEDARANLDFYARVMGLRLVGKSVNQDDPTVYHLFFADEEAHPGADLTFFEYPGARQGRAGDGMVHRISWRIADEAALDFWEDRLAGEGLGSERAPGTLRFRDPEGLGLELAVSDAPDEPLVAVHPEIPRASALLGFAGVRAYARQPAASGYVLDTVLGAARLSDDAWELRGARRGATYAYDPPPTAPGIPGAGTVHHVAWHTTVAEHPRWLDRLGELGVSSTPVIDRHFFHSIYFREPSGVLFEIADDGPGFAADGNVADLGRPLLLPPFLENRRAAIEARLVPLPDPRARWPRPQVAADSTVEA